MCAVSYELLYPVECLWRDAIVCEFVEEALVGKCFLGSSIPQSLGAPLPLL